MIERVRSLIVPHDRLYIDANIVVYYVEDAGGLSDIAAECISHCVTHGARMVTSEISLAECLWGAYKQKHEPLADMYRNWLFDETLIELYPIDIHVLELAAATGPRFNLRLADAIHVASAVSAECKAILTNDKRLRVPAGLEIIQLSELH